MKKILFVFALFLTFSMNAQEKYTFENALRHLNIDEAVIEKVMLLDKEKRDAKRAIKQGDLSPEEKIIQEKKTNKEGNAKIIAILGREKYDEAKKYFRATRPRKEKI